jgi:hypothetical protein
VWSRGLSNLFVASHARSQPDASSSGLTVDISTFWLIISQNFGRKIAGCRYYTIDFFFCQKLSITTGLGIGRLVRIVESSFKPRMDWIVHENDTSAGMALRVLNNTEWFIELFSSYLKEETGHEQWFVKAILYITL